MHLQENFVLQDAIKKKEESHLNYFNKVQVLEREIELLQKSNHSQVEQLQAEMAKLADQN